ncbi:uncharacterized protein VP01_1097g2 [Puccinia sorghi]|uniref:Reverse transcriptase Ty1/copia-type domain-containing protein n=1 Tax=Puccinia sorghi TaxID=27349 RepID=A0A0L6VT75_9BASI|nr:uncharacterized protein VP01_1097g2 [Puccinia sorghi]
MMEDLGQASSLLGMKLTHLPGVIRMSQQHYAEKLLSTYRLINGKTVATPMVPGTRLKKASYTDCQAFLDSLQHKLRDMLAKGRV